MKSFICILFIFFNFYSFCQIGETIKEESLGAFISFKDYNTGVENDTGVTGESFGAFYFREFSKNLNYGFDVEYANVKEEDHGIIRNEWKGLDDKISEFRIIPSIQFVSNREKLLTLVLQAGPSLGFINYKNYTLNSFDSGPILEEERKGFAFGYNLGAGIKYEFKAMNNLYIQPTYQHSANNKDIKATNISARIGFVLYN